MSQTLDSEVELAFREAYLDEIERTSPVECDKEIDQHLTFAQAMSTIFRFEKDFLKHNFDALYSAFGEGIDKLNGAWLSDHWSGNTMVGLKKFVDKYGIDALSDGMYEMGIGIGTNLMFLKALGVKKLYGGDINEFAIVSSLKNLPRIQDGKLILEINSLLDINGSIKPEIDKNGRINVTVFGCIPQLKGEVADPSDLGNYYKVEALYADLKERGFSKEDIEKVAKWDFHFNLGLNARALLEAQRDLEPGKFVMLNLAGRTGLENLKAMFADFGFNPEIIHAGNVMQDPNSKNGVKELADQEAAGQKKFEFYLTDECKEEDKIDATKALELMNLNTQVFHKIYFIAGQQPQPLEA